MSRRAAVMLAADCFAVVAVLVGLFNPTHNAALAAMTWAAGWLVRGLVWHWWLGGEP